VTKIFFVADTERRPLPFTQTQGPLIIHLPPEAPDAIASVVCIEHLP
jgi:hypothetical protein